MPTLPREIVVTININSLSAEALRQSGLGPKLKEYLRQESEAPDYAISERGLRALEALNAGDRES